MADKFSMDDYVDVAERIQDLMDAHPAASLQEWRPPEVMVIGDHTFVVYHAAAYRHPEDPRPGVGVAWEPFPGKTPYTKDSELMNAQTAAFGRAIIALGLTANRKLASRQEVRARVEDQAAEAGEKPTAAAIAKAKPISKEQVKEIANLYRESGWKDDSAEDPHATLRMQLLMVDAANEGEIPALIAKLTGAQAETLTKALKDKDAK